jgi:hypothetical protein
MEYSPKRYNVEFLGIPEQMQISILNILNEAQLNKIFIKSEISNKFNLSNSSFRYFETLYTDLLILNFSELEDNIISAMKFIMSRVLTIPIVSINCLNKLQVENTVLFSAFHKTEDIVEIYNSLDKLNEFQNELILGAKSLFNKKPKLNISDAIIVYNSWFRVLEKDNQISLNSNTLLDEIIIDKIEKNLIQHRGCCK